MRMFFLFLIGLTFGAAGGFVFAAANGLTLDGHDHSDPAHHAGAGGAAHQAMHDQPIELAPDAAPTLDIAVTPDPVAGYNLQVMVSGFAFAPAHASGPHIAGEGHAHVYANGVKLARVYGPWMHLDALPQGEVEIAVTLSSNDHRPLAVDGQPIAAKTYVTVD